MARDKMFDPAYQKAFTEIINKEKKIRSLNFVEDIGGIPRTARVNFSADFQSDESDTEEDENEKFEKLPREVCDRCGNNMEEEEKMEGKLKEQTPDVKLESRSSDTAMKKRSQEKTGNRRYIFPICNFCDFGWKYSSRKYVVCPYHGPFRKGRSGYSQAISEYIADQSRREDCNQKYQQKAGQQLRNSFYL